MNKLGKRETFSVHRLVAICFLNHAGFSDAKLVVDHINNIKTDNRVENLQIITNRENTSKNKTSGTSKYIGVSWYSRDSKWQASIRINNKLQSLGRYNCELEASEAYNKALIKLTNKEKASVN